jgi:hypothetical protein
MDLPLAGKANQRPKDGLAPSSLTSCNVHQ